MGVGPFARLTLRLSRELSSGAGPGSLPRDRPGAGAGGGGRSSCAAAGDQSAEGPQAPLFGFGDQAPPSDDRGYLDFARALANPRLADLIEHRTHPEPTHQYVNVGNQWNQYHKLRAWPERLLALGDSVCVFNPVYGQGLTVAALEAGLLHRMLTAYRRNGKGLDGLSRKYQRRLARLLLVPWTLSSSSDLMWTPGGQPLSARAAHWYNKHVFAVAVHDPDVWSRFARVANMVAPPSVLFHPSVLVKVLGSALFHRRTPPATHPDPGIPEQFADVASASLSGERGTRTPTMD